jgi:predicted ester cyclase
MLGTGESELYDYDVDRKEKDGLLRSGSKVCQREYSFHSMKDDLAIKIKSANAALMENGNIDAVSDFFSPDYVAHLTGEDITGGHTAIRQIVSLYRRAFSGVKTTVDILAIQGERIAWQRTLQATHRAPFKGFPATNRPIIWRDMITSRFRDGLIAEEWFISDLAEQLLLARKNLKK